MRTQTFLGPLRTWEANSVWKASAAFGMLNSLHFFLVLLIFTRLVVYILLKLPVLIDWNSIEVTLKVSVFFFFLNFCRNTCSIRFFLILHWMEQSKLAAESPYKEVGFLFHVLNPNNILCLCILRVLYLFLNI